MPARRPNRDDNGRFAPTANACPPPVASMAYFEPRVGKSYQITRQRFIELTKIAKDTAAYVERRGLRREEQCVFGNLVQRMLEI